MKTFYFFLFILERDGTFIGVIESVSQSGISLDKAIAKHARRRTQASKEACLSVIKGRKKKRWVEIINRFFCLEFGGTLHFFAMTCEYKE